MAAHVSLILPVRDDVALTLRCLQAIARLPDEPSFEVIVVDDAADEQTRALLAGLEGDVRVLHNDEPVGFGSACDQAAAVAQGAVLVLLDTDAVPADGWLDDLLAPLQGDGPRVPAAALARSLDLAGAELPEALWLGLAVRAEAYVAAGGFAATRRPAEGEKASLLHGLRDAGAGAVAPARAAVLLQVPAVLAP
jgi:GT2 family glycosyltransferase